MTDDQNNSTDQDVQNLTDELNSLLVEAQSISRDIDETNEWAKKETDSVEKDVNGSVEKLEQIYSELDKVDEETDNELDKLMLQEAEDLANEEE